MGKRPTPAVLQECGQVMNDLLELGCPHIHHGEDVDQFSKILLADLESNPGDRNDIHRWFAFKLIGEQTSELDIQQIKDMLGLASSDGSSDVQKLESWKLLIRLFRAKIRSEANQVVDPATQLFQARHYLSYIVNNVYSQDNSVNKSGKIFQLPRDLSSDPKLSSGKSKLPNLEVLETIRSSLGEALADIPADEEDHGDDGGEDESPEEMHEKDNLTDAVAMFQRSSRAYSLVHKSELAPWIGASRLNNTERSGDGELEQNLDKMFEAVAKISERQQNHHQIRSTASDIVQAIKDIQ